MSEADDVSCRRPEDRVRAAGERGLAMLGRQGWLDRPSYRLEHALVLQPHLWWQVVGGVVGSFCAGLVASSPG